MGPTDSAHVAKSTDAATHPLRLCAIAEDVGVHTLQVQSAAAVGSFAYGVPDGLKAVVDSGGLKSLVHALYSPDEHVVHAAVRSLKMIYKVSKHTPRGNEQTQPCKLCE
jgi:hypothetical protein